jgi:hypothetical protein
VILALDHADIIAIETGPHPDERIHRIRYVRQKRERLIVVNPIAKSVVEARRGISPTHVFTYKDKPIIRMVTAEDRQGLFGHRSARIITRCSVAELSRVIAVRRALQSSATS